LVLAARKVNPGYRRENRGGMVESPLAQPNGENDWSTRGAASHTRRRLKVGRFLLTVGSILVLSFLLVAGHTRVAALGYRMTDLQEQLSEVQAENEYLQVKVGQLRTPARVEEAARNQGMTYHGERRFVSIDPQVVLARAHAEAEPTSAVVSLLGTDSAANESAKLAAAAPPSLDVVSQWFFEWLTGMRTAEAGPR